MKKEYDLIVVGAGPGGIMAALTARKYNNTSKIALVESGKALGQKLAMTGGGRCNFTNNRPIEEFFDMIVNNKKFLYSSLYTFTNEDLKSFVRSLGLDYHVEVYNDQKVYIKSGRARDFIGALEDKLKDANVDIFLESNVEDINIEGRIKSVKFKDYLLSAGQLVFATGGLSFPKTGSDGSIFGLLKARGYDIVSPRPGLVPIEINEKWVKNLAGISMNKVLVWTKVGKKRKEILGDIIFTHKGLGGPAILKMSSYINDNPINKEIFIDFLPAMSRDQVYNLAINDRKKTIGVNLRGSLPNNFIKFILDELSRKIEFDLLGQTTANMTKEKIDIVVDAIKEAKFTVKKLAGIETATITAGGISHKQINPASMESKLHPGVYFVGEMIDVDALTGGFNLQIAFSTGYLAGMSLAESLKAK